MYRYFYRMGVLTYGGLEFQEILQANISTLPSGAVSEFIDELALIIEVD